MFNVKNNNPSTSRFPHFSTNHMEISSDELSNNRDLFTTDQRNNYQTDSSSSTHSNDPNGGVHNNSSRRIARLVRFVNKTLPRKNSSSMLRNTRANIFCSGEQPTNSVRSHQEQGTNEASQQPSASSDLHHELMRRLTIDRSSTTTRTNNEEDNNDDDDDDDDDDYVDVGDLSSSEDDDDTPFESMYNRRIPIPSTLFANARRVASSRPGVRHNTRRHSLRRQSRYITPDQFNWESPLSHSSHSTPRRNQPSSTTYSSAFANILPLSLSHSRSLSLPSNSNVTNDSRSIHSHKRSQSKSRKLSSQEQISTKSNAVNDDDQTEDCLICIEPLELRGGRMILNPGCGHLMHMKCYMEYINNCKDSCAICAKKFPGWDH